jgi:hypothetical protein
MATRSDVKIRMIKSDFYRMYDAAKTENEDAYKLLSDAQYYRDPKLISSNNDNLEDVFISWDYFKWYDYGRHDGCSWIHSYCRQRTRYGSRVIIVREDGYIDTEADYEGVAGTGDKCLWDEFYSEVKITTPQAYREVDMPIKQNNPVEIKGLI